MQDPAFFLKFHPIGLPGVMMRSTKSSDMSQIGGAGGQEKKMSQIQIRTFNKQDPA